MKIKILVSGADGQLGRSLQVIAAIHPEIEFTFCNRNSLDLADAKSIQAALTKDYNYFINAGAYTKVDQAETETELSYKINSEALDIIGKTVSPGCTVIHISTDYVYHLDIIEALTEEMDCDPKSVYAKSKLTGEQNLLTHRTDSIIIRSSWIYSEYGHNFVKTMLRLSNEHPGLKIVSDQIGTPTYAYDLAKAIVDIILYIEHNKGSKQNFGGIYNYSNEGISNWAEFAEAIFDYCGKECSVEKIRSEEFPTVAARPKWSFMSKDKIKSRFELDIPDWRSSLKSCLDKLGCE